VGAGGARAPSSPSKGVTGDPCNLNSASPSQDKEPRGIIPLENLSIREVDDPRKPVRLTRCLSLNLYLHVLTQGPLTCPLPCVLELL
jgi:hypothetical protein